MKKNFYVALCVLAIGLVSCNKKAETIQDLKAKYEGKSFTNCQAFFSAYDEILNVYFATIDRAYEGNEEALKEIEGFKQLFSSLNEETEKIAAECPEKFEEFEKNLEERMQQVFPKLIEIEGRTLNSDEINIDENPTLEGLEEAGEELNQEEILEVVEVEVTE